MGSVTSSIFNDAFLQTYNGRKDNTLEYELRIYIWGNVDIKIAIACAESNLLLKELVVQTLEQHRKFTENTPSVFCSKTEIGHQKYSNPLGSNSNFKERLKCLLPLMMPLVYFG